MRIKTRKMCPPKVFLIVFSTFCIVQIIDAGTPLTVKQGPPKAFSGKRCKATANCATAAGLQCWNGLCVCRFPDHQIFQQNQCISVAHGPCAIKDSNVTFSCTANAECVDNPQGGHKICQCAGTSVESENGYCDLSYGQECDVSKPPVTMCSRTALMDCIEGTCKCHDELHVYDETAKKCVGTLGASCLQNKDEGQCSGGTYCKFTPTPNSLHGICTCQDGFHWNGKECGKS